MLKMTDTLACGYSMRVLSKSYLMNTNMTWFRCFSKIFYILVLCTKVASALEGLISRHEYMRVFCWLDWVSSCSLQSWCQSVCYVWSYVDQRLAASLQYFQSFLNYWVVVKSPAVTRQYFLHPRNQSAAIGGLLIGELFAIYKINWSFQVNNPQVTLKTLHLHFLPQSRLTPYAAGG